MSKVTDCARALGQAIVDSEEYKAMQITEAKDGMHAAMSAGNADEIARFSQEMDDAQQTLNAMPAVDAMTTARQNFSELMNQVNHVLEFMITGEVEQGGGCTGNCASCGGCH